MRRCISYIDSKIQAQLYNLNPDIVGNLCMHLDNLGLHMLYPTSLNLGSFFFFNTMCFSFDFAVICKPTSQIQQFNPLSQNVSNSRPDTNPEHGMSLKPCRLQCVSCLSLHWAGLQTTAGTGFLSDSALLGQTAPSKELSI